MSASGACHQSSAWKLKSCTLPNNGLESWNCLLAVTPFQLHAISWLLSQNEDKSWNLQDTNMSEILLSYIRNFLYSRDNYAFTDKLSTWKQICRVVRHTHIKNQCILGHIEPIFHMAGVCFIELLQIWLIFLCIYSTFPVHSCKIMTFDK